MCPSPRPDPAGRRGYQRCVPVAFSRSVPEPIPFSFQFISCSSSSIYKGNGNHFQFHATSIEFPPHQRTFAAEDFRPKFYIDWDTCHPTITAQVCEGLSLKKKKNNIPPHVPLFITNLPHCLLLPIKKKSRSRSFFCCCYRHTENTYKNPPFN